MNPPEAGRDGENPPPVDLSKGEVNAMGSDEDRPTRRCAPVEADDIPLG
jgi:hypothetical protein